jgi:hypothetical protein
MIVIVRLMEVSVLYSSLEHSPSYSGEKMNFICPYCKTPLIPFDDYTFYCECHPLKNYQSRGDRYFSWKYQKGKWEYIEINGSSWKIPDKIPIKKEHFIFR